MNKQNLTKVKCDLCNPEGNLDFIPNPTCYGCDGSGWIRVYKVKVTVDSSDGDFESFYKRNKSEKEKND